MSQFSLSRWQSVGIGALFVGALGVIATLGYILGPAGYVAGIGVIVALCLTLLILLYPTMGMTLLIFCLPFERIPSVDVGGVSLKLNLFVGGVTILGAIASLILRRQPLRLTTTHWLLVAYLAVAGCSYLGAVEQARALQVIVFTTFTFLLAWVVPQLLTSGLILRRLLMVLGWSALVVGLFGLFQFVGDLVGLPNGLTGLDPGFGKEVFGFPRIQAFSLEPLYLGDYLLLPLSLLFTLILTQSRLVPRPVLWGLFGLLSVVLVLTVSRGAYIAAVVSVLVIAMSLPREVLQPKHLLLGALAIVVVGGASILFLARSHPEALVTFQEHVLLGDFVGSESGEGRVVGFVAAFDEWRERPWLGVGPGNFGPAITGYPNPVTVEHSPIVNNQYLELLAETGLVGFLLIMLVFGIVLSRSVIALRHVGDPLVRATLIGGTAAFVGMLVQYNFFSTLYIIHIWVTVGLLLAVQTLALGPKAVAATEPV
ncbi:MAG: O-antigen ligase family protein [Patescibacteria group bacterium]